MSVLHNRARRLQVVRPGSDRPGRSEKVSLKDRLQSPVANHLGPGGPSSISQACKLPRASRNVWAEADSAVFGDDETAGDREQARSAASVGRKKQNPNVSHLASHRSMEKCD